MMLGGIGWTEEPHPENSASTAQHNTRVTIFKTVLLFMQPQFAASRGLACAKGGTMIVRVAFTRTKEGKS
jgi:hypothetical protein